MMLNQRPAHSDPSLKMPVVPLEDRNWEEYAALDQQTVWQTAGSVTK